MADSGTERFDFEHSSAGSSVRGRATGELADSISPRYEHFALVKVCDITRGGRAVDPLPAQDGARAAHQIAREVENPCRVPPLDV